MNINRNEIKPTRRKGLALGYCAISAGIAIALVVATAVPAIANPGQEIAATVCVACHGDEGNSAVPMFPKLAGLQEEYITKQLKEFVSGQRKSDVMAPVVAKLKPQDIQALAAYYAARQATPGDAPDAVLAEEGKKIYLDGNEETGVPACIGCHYAEGAGTGVYPRLRAQHATYIVQQLKNFKAGDRSNDVSRFMRTVAKRLSDREMQAVAEYLTGLDPK